MHGVPHCSRVLLCSSFGKSWFESRKETEPTCISGQPLWGSAVTSGCCWFVCVCQSCSWPCRKCPVLLKNTAHAPRSFLLPSFPRTAFPLFFRDNMVVLSHFNFSASYDTNPSLEYLLLWSDGPSAFTVLISPQQLANKTPPIAYNIFFLSSSCIASLESNSTCSPTETWKKNHFFLLAVFLWTSPSRFTAVLPPG